jgi:hypothetical protein
LARSSELVEKIARSAAGAGALQKEDWAADRVDRRAVGAELIGALAGGSAAATARTPVNSSGTKVSKFSRAVFGLIGTPPTAKRPKATNKYIT